MIALFADGRRIAEWAAEDEAILEAIRNDKLVFRDASGKVIARATAADEAFWPPDPDYTLNDHRRDVSQGGRFTLAEIWHELGAT